MQSNEVCVVGLQKHTIAQQGNPAIDTARRASPTSPCVRGRLYCQIWRPVRASSAHTAFTAVTYMIPSATTGVVCRARAATGAGNVHLGASRATFIRLI